MAAPRSRLRKPTVVGILNITPDSFSDGGNFLSLPGAIDRAAAMIAEGVDVIEVGGESTRPGATPVEPADEIQRSVPAIEAIRARWPHIRIAIDTVKSQVASAAVAAGASIVNDVSALRLDRQVADICASNDCTLVLMHSRGSVASMAGFVDAEYADSASAGAPVARAVRDELGRSAQTALSAGVRRDRIVLDPGLGFSKRAPQSVQALANLPVLLELGFQVMVGASRKRFIGELSGVQEPTKRGAGTIGANVVALTLGATWFRVHDVLPNRQALDTAWAILEARA